MKSMHETKKRKISEMSTASSFSGIRTTDDLHNQVESKDRKILPLSQVEDREESNARKYRDNRKEPAVVAVSTVDDEDAILDEEAMIKAIKRAKREEGLKTKTGEFLQLREELLKSRRAVNVLTGAEAATVCHLL